VFAGNTALLVHNCGGAVGGHDATCACATGGPVSGPRNAGLAGGNHPNTNVPFDSRGFPDFAGHTDPSVPDVFITLTDAVMLDYADSGTDGEPSVAYVLAGGGKHRVAETFQQFMTGFVPEDTFDDDEDE
jgi:hypothetical protein